jgi:hypothetical protein
MHPSPPPALRTAVNDTLCQHLEEVLIIKYHAVTDPREALNKTTSKRQRLGGGAGNIAGVWLGGQGLVQYRHPVVSVICQR